MILLRLSKAIRQQDWFAVLIEFAVVVLGIFAGLQANAWAQERQDRKQERAALERLFLESEGAYTLLHGNLQQAERLNRVRRAAVQFADSQAPVPENELPLKIGINTLSRFPPAMPVSVAYDELRSAGQMQLIRSAELRSQLAEFHTELAYYNQLQQGFADSGEGFFNVYQRHVIWDYNPESTTTDILLSTYDWESLRADEAFIFAIIGLLRNQLVSEQGLADLRDRAKSLCDALGNIVQRTCSSS